MKTDTNIKRNYKYMDEHLVTHSKGKDYTEKPTCPHCKSKNVNLSNIPRAYKQIGTGRTKLKYSIIYDVFIYVCKDCPTDFTTEISDTVTSRSFFKERNKIYSKSNLILNI